MIQLAQSGKVRRAVPAVLGLAAVAVLAAPAAAKLKTVSNSTAITTGAPTITAKCPRHTEAVSGGFANPQFSTSGSTSEIFPFQSQRGSARAWKGSAFNEESESGRFIVFGYCDPHQPGLVARSKERGIDSSEVVSVTAKCPRGSEAVAGGFSNPDFDNFQSASSADAFPSASKRVGERRWKVTAYNQGSGPGTIVSVVYCDTAEPGLTTRTKDVSIADNELGSATAKCPKGRKAVSGGFEGHAVDVTSIGALGAFPYVSKRLPSRGWKTSAEGSGDSTLTSFAYCRR